MIAVDIGGTKLALRAEAAGVTWTAREHWSGADADQLVALLTRARRRIGDRIDRVAVACAPSLDPAGRVVAWPSRPSWVGLPLRELVSAATGADDIVFSDDGTLAALAEADAAGCPDLVYIGLGTGVGGGIVSGGRLLVGFDGGAGEIGHLTVDRHGRPCSCGRRGCLQATASGVALERRAGELRGARTTTVQLVEAIHAGDPWALQVFAEAADAIAAAVTAIDEVVRPARVHLGGGVGRALPDLPRRVTAGLARQRRLGRSLPTVHAAASPGNESLAGALLAARQGDLNPRIRP
jgi:kanosamine 6-kinase